MTRFALVSSSAVAIVTLATACGSVVNVGGPVPDAAALVKESGVSPDGSSGCGPKPAVDTCSQPPCNSVLMCVGTFWGCGCQDGFTPVDAGPIDASPTDASPTDANSCGPQPHLACPPNADAGCSESPQCIGTTWQCACTPPADAGPCGPVPTQTQSCPTQWMCVGTTWQCDQADAGALCPATMPTAGAACPATKPTPVSCEYGSDPALECDTVMTCNAGAWTVSQTPFAGGFCATTSAALCPASSALVAQGTTCGSTFAECSYPDARCECRCPGPGNGVNCVPATAAMTWQCDTLSNQTGNCPATRPRLGTPCATPSETCYYEGSPGPACWGDVVMCTADGVWINAGGAGC